MPVSEDVDEEEVWLLVDEEEVELGGMLGEVERW